MSKEVAVILCFIIVCISFLLGMAFSNKAGPLRLSFDGSSLIVPRQIEIVEKEDAYHAYYYQEGELHFYSTIYKEDMQKRSKK